MIKACKIFQHTFIGCLLLLFLGNGIALAQLQSELRAVKITNVDSQVMFDDDRIAEAMDYLASIGVNTVVPVVWNANSANGDYPLYPSAVFEKYFGTKIHPRFEGRDVLERIIIEAHRNGMEVLPWFEMGFSTSYTQNGGHILQKYPDWALHDKSGKLVVKNGFDWMSNIHSGPQNLLLEMTEEIVSTYDVEGVEYSDRIPAMPYEGGYEPFTVSLYQKEHGGNSPPDDPKDPTWLRWRADKLNDWFQRVRVAVKKHGAYLTVAASPSLFPWSYMEYLQDSATWMKNGIVDEIIPQLYRYNITDYVKELNLSLPHYPDAPNGYYAGVLMKVGSYLISTEFLTKTIEANRARGVQGEVFFFYEGLRAQNNLLGNLLQKTAYNKPALVPARGGVVFRPPATFPEPLKPLSGNWQPLTTTGYKNKALFGSISTNAQLDYIFRIPFTAWFDVFVHQTPQTNQSRKALFSLKGAHEQVVKAFDQTDFGVKGWQKIGTVFLEKGERTVIRLEKGEASESTLVAGEAMVMINRRKSPDVLVNTHKEKPQNSISNTFFAFPNPTSGATTIRFSLDNGSPVQISVYDLTGRHLQNLLEGQFPAGTHEHLWTPTDRLPPGIYLIRLSTNQAMWQYKLLHLRP